ncbi:MAG: glycosyltransferase [Flavobacteriales bacterium]|nr:glycosyltransferase [Flavobacteriales bacterium]
MNVDYILFLIFVLSVVVQLYFYLFVYYRWTEDEEKTETFTKAVSVIICGYNEEKHWESLVEKLLQQDYLNYEIVLVNDQSTDNTKFIFKQWENHPKIKLVDIPESIKKGLGKKFALTLGIKAAKYDCLLLTDADCYPKDASWISSMVQHFATKDIVLGYGAYEKRPGFLNKLIRFDTFQVAIQYFSYALMGKAYMGVGRNLAYKKNLFFDNKGFASHLHLPSGDDDLFIKEVSTPTNTAISTSISAHSFSEPKTTWSSWIRQKSRHLSTGLYYKSFHKQMLGLWTASQLLFWIVFIVLLLKQFFIPYLILIVAIRLTVQLIVSYPLLKKTEEEDLLVFYPFLELTYIVFYLIFMLKSMLNKKRFW